MRLSLVLLLFALTASAQTLTHYAYPGDSTPDANSAAGIGNHNNHLVALQSAAVSSDLVAQNHLSVGQSFSIQSNGQTYNLIYDDTTGNSPATGRPLTNRVDIYDPTNALGGGNNFSAPITSIDNGPVLSGSGVGFTPTTASNTPDATSGAIFTHSQLQPVVDTLLANFKAAGQSWITPIMNAATTLFWILALISLTFTGVWMAIRQVDLMEVCAELVRYILFTGFFWWLLSHAPDFAGKIIASLRQIGGQATGAGGAIFPDALFNLGMQVFQNSLSHINLFMPETVIIPFVISLIILIICMLIAANVVLLLVAAWVVLFAGLIFLGFGGCRWTSDMAINYYRTMLGIGVSLMTMQLIVGIGITFLQNLVTLSGNNPDIQGLASIMAATILLAVISHKLPKIVAEIATGGGYGGHVGGYSFMAMMGGMMAAASLAARGATGMAGAGRTAHENLLDRMSVLNEVSSNKQK